MIKVNCCIQYQDIFFLIQICLWIKKDKVCLKGQCMQKNDLRITNLFPFFACAMTDKICYIWIFIFIQILMSANVVYIKKFFLPIFLKLLLCFKILLKGRVSRYFRIRKNADLNPKIIVNLFQIPKIIFESEFGKENTYLQHCTSLAETCKKK
jgi:hypothetical protein